MAALTNGAAMDGILEVPLANGDETLELDFNDICNQSSDMLEILSGTFKTERLASSYWTRSVAEYWKRGKREWAVILAEMGIRALREQGQNDSTLPLLCQLANFDLVLAKAAPTLRIEARQDHIPADVQLKKAYFDRAAARINEASMYDPTHPLVLDARAQLCLAQGKDMEKEATAAIDAILSASPNSIPGLFGRARLHVRAGGHRAALKLYQRILQMAPQTLPDPRIGIGSCLWALGDKARARQAWERSMAVNPGSNSANAQLLLGLSHYAASKDQTLPEDFRLEEIKKAAMHLQQVFKASQAPGAAAALANYMLTTGNWQRAAKLAERAVQYADIGPLVGEGHLALGRSLHAQGELEAAQREYSLAVASYSDPVLAAYPIMAASQIFVAKADYMHAINALDNIFRRDPQCIEALANLAAVRAHLAFTSRSRTDAETERTQARELYDQITRMFATRVRRPGVDATDELVVPPRIADVMRDPELYVDVARLAGESDINLALKGYRESLLARESSGMTVPPALLNNVGVMEWRKGEVQSAQEKIQRALTEGAEATAAADEDPQTKEGVTITMMYNLAAVSEDLGDLEQAKSIHERLLARHPEYVDAKARLSLMALKARDFAGADAHLKEALESQPESVDLRALYTYFLVESNQVKFARDFVSATLNKHDKTDVYSLCAYGSLVYTQARENKHPGPEAAQDRDVKFVRAAECFDKALQIDPHCSFAAQGLAIVLAENTLPTPTATGPSGGQTDSATRIKNTRDAVSILTKVRESLNNASVYVNLGHCHYTREEFERAIENYGAASRRFYDDRNVPILLYLTRAWFQKAVRDSSYSAMQNALSHAEQAEALSPNDPSITYNLALIKQRGLEILLGLPQERRTLAELNRAMQAAAEAQKAFGELASQPASSSNVAFDRDLAHHRSRYGESQLSRVPDVIAAQQSYESTEHARLTRAKQQREAERQAIQEAERKRLQEIAERNERLARERKELQETTATWYVPPKDDEDEVAPRGARKGKAKRKVKVEGIVDDGDVDEGIEPPSEDDDENVERPRKKRMKKAMKSRDASTGSGGDDEDAPVVAPSKKRKSGKVYKSAEFIDSDSSE